MLFRSASVALPRDHPGEARLLSGALDALDLPRREPGRRLRSPGTPGSRGAARALFRVPSFFAGWLTSELAAHHIAWQAMATVCFVAAGALAEWPGRVGLAVTLCSWAGLLGQLGLGRRSGETVETRARGRSRARVTASGSRGVGREAGIPRAARAAGGPLPLPGRRGHQRARPPLRRGRGPAPAPRRPRAAGRRASAPVLLQIHGGGWTIGNKRQQAMPLMMHLARRGWTASPPTIGSRRAPPSPIT